MTGSAIDRARTPAPIAAGVALLLPLATMGEGGGAAGSLVVWHGMLVALVVLSLVAPRATGVRACFPPGVVLAAACFGVLALVGAFRAPYAFAAWLVLFEMAAFVALVWLAARAGRGLLEFLIWPLAATAAAQGAYGVIQATLGELGRPSGTFLIPNHFALWLVAVGCLQLQAAIESRSPVVRTVLLALLVPLVAGVALSGSRGALVALVAGGAWLAGVNRKRIPRGWGIGVVVAIVAVVAVLGARQLSRLQDYDPFRYSRPLIWKASLGACADDPWWGTGPGQFQTAAANLRFPDAEAPLRFDRVFSTTHSDLLRVPAEFGIPAAVALLAVALALVASVVRRRRRGRLVPLGDGAIAALLAIAAQGLVDNPSTWSATYLLAAVLIGALLARSDDRPAVASRPVRAAFALAVLLTFVVGDIATYLAWREVARIPRGRLAPGQLVRLERALRLNPIHPDLRLRLAEHHAGFVAGSSWDVTDYAAARTAAEEAVRLNPGAADFHRGLARVESRACRGLFDDDACRDRARAHYRNAAQRARYDVPILIELAAFLIDMGDPVGARRVAERALALEPEAALTRLLLADAVLEAGGAGATGRAEAILAEAEAHALRWEDRIEGPYARQLLALDPRSVERIRRKIVEVAGRARATSNGTVPAARPR